MIWTWHILFLQETMWCLHRFLISLCNVYTYFELSLWFFNDLKICTSTFCKQNIPLCYDTILFFWTLLHKAWNRSFPHRNGKSLSVTRSPVFQPIMVFGDLLYVFLFVCCCFFFCFFCFFFCFFWYWLMSDWEPSTFATLFQ